jgi:hypothetical protein
MREIMGADTAGEQSNDQLEADTTVTLVHLDQLENPLEPPDLPGPVWAIDTSHDVTHPARLAVTGAYPSGKIPRRDDMESLKVKFERFLALQYILVGRVHEYRPPEPNEDGSFSSGSVVGDVLLFEITSHEYLGGARFSASSSFSVEYLTDRAPWSRERSKAEWALEGDLLESTKANLLDEIQSTLPGADISLDY